MSFIPIFYIQDVEETELSEFLPATVGSKAAGLAEMEHMGLPIPVAFTLPTDLTFMSARTKGKPLRLALESAVKIIADETGTFWVGGGRKPLTVSVRSGAVVSMPGMMKTILNVGLTRDRIEFLTKSYDANPAFGFDCYRRLIQMYGETVMGIDKAAFLEYYDAAKDFFIDVSSSERASTILVEKYEKVYERETGRSFPQNPTTQLHESVKAVFASWNSPVCKEYRDAMGIDDSLGTSVTVQQMVFGNTGPQSGTGVVFTHDPNTGVKGFFGDFLVCAQGEDAVSGTHLTLPIQELFKSSDFSGAGKQLKAILTRLYQAKKEILDIEFTIDNGELFILQCRTAKRTRRASIHFALALAKEGEITTTEATSRIIDLLPSQELVTESGPMEMVGFGVGIGEGTVSAPIVLDRSMAETYMNEGKPFIYVAKDTSPDDHVQMAASVGILTATGGSLSHAAIIARSWEKTCVVGFSDMTVCDGYIIVDNRKLYPGEVIQITGENGAVYVSV